jgi:hypothetical protein
VLVSAANTAPALANTMVKATANVKTTHKNLFFFISFVLSQVIFGFEHTRGL